MVHDSPDYRGLGTGGIFSGYGRVPVDLGVRAVTYDHITHDCKRIADRYELRRAHNAHSDWTARATGYMLYTRRDERESGRVDKDGRERGFVQIPIHGSCTYDLIEVYKPLYALKQRIFAPRHVARWRSENQCRSAMHDQRFQHAVGIYSA